MLAEQAGTALRRRSALALAAAVALPGGLPRAIAYASSPPSASTRRTAASPSMHSSAADTSPPSDGIIRYHQLWVDDKGETHMLRATEFGGLEKKVFAQNAMQYVRSFSEDFKVTNVVVTQQFGDNPWHHCPAPQFVITLAGSWFVRTTDGETLVMQPGDCLFQDNVKAHPCAEEGTRKAMHFSGVCGEAPCNQLVIQVDVQPLVGQPGRWSR